MRSARGVVGSLLAVAGVHACGGLNDGEIRTRAESGGSSGAGGSSTVKGGRSFGEGGSAGESEPMLGGRGGEGGEPASSGGTSAGTSSGGDVGTGEGGEPEPDAVLSLESITPKQGARGVDSAAPIELRFSDELQANTVTESSVQVFFGNDAVPGELTVTGNSVRFVARERWTLLGSYEVRVSGALRSQRGAALEKPLVRQFAVRDGAFSSPAQLNEQAIASVAFAGPVIDARGNAWIAWHEAAAPGSASDLVQARAFVPGEGFGAPIAIGDCAGACQRVSVAGNTDGAVMVTWVEQTAPNVQRIRARRYVAGKWEKPVDVVDPCANDVTKAQCTVGALETAVTETGQFHVLSSWSLRDAMTQQTTVVSGFESSAGQPFSGGDVATDTGYPDHLALSFDANGNGMVAWVQPGGVYSHRYVAGLSTPYQGEEVIPGSKDAALPSLASAGVGDFAAVWFGASGPLFARHSLKGGWTQAAEIPHPSGSATSYAPSLTAVSGGYITAWAQDLASTTNAYVARTEGNTFGEAALLSDGLRRVSYYTTVGLGADPQGNLLAAWVQQEGGPEKTAVGIGRSLTTFAPAWRVQPPISGEPANYLEARVAVAANGVAVVTWAQGSPGAFTGFHAVSFE